MAKARKKVKTVKAGKGAVQTRKSAPSPQAASARSVAALPAAAKAARVAPSGLGARSAHAPESVPTGSRSFVATAKPAAPARERIFIVDDHPIVRQGMKQLIESAGDLVVCGEAATGDEAVEAVGKLQPRLVVADLSLPGKPGIEVIKDIKARWPDIYILVVSMHEEGMYAERVLRAGAMGYVMKQEAQGKILLAIRRILSGQVYVSDRIASGVLRQLTAGGHAQPKSSLELLTDRELEIFHAIGDGKTVRVIAQMLHLSVKTVEAHREHIKNKLQLSSSNELLRMAVQRAMEE